MSAIWTPYLVTGGIAVGMALAGGLSTPIGDWYRQLKKPKLQPPDWLFGPAWTLILASAAAACGMAWTAAGGVAEAEQRLIIAGGLNVLFFLLWSPLFFLLRRPDWSMIEILPFWGSIFGLILVVAPLSEPAAWLLVPYISWVSFAAGLNWRVVRLNGPFGQGRPIPSPDPQAD